MIYGVLETAGELRTFKFLFFLISIQRFYGTDVVLPFAILVIEFLRVAIAGTFKMNINFTI